MKFIWVAKFATHMNTYSGACSKKSNTFNFYKNQFEVIRLVLILKLTNSISKSDVSTIQKLIVGNCMCEEIVLCPKQESRPDSWTKNNNEDVNYKPFHCGQASDFKTH